MAVSPGQNPDAVFYGADVGGSWANLITDGSGEATNLTKGATNFAYESTSARSNLITRRTVDWNGDLDPTSDNGVIFMWDRGGGDYSQMSFDGMGSIDITVNGGSTTESYMIQNTSATEEFVVVWSMEPNPDTTGASDAMRSELWIENTDQTTYEIHRWTHVVEAADASGTLVFGASDTSGTSEFTGTTYKIRLSSSFHSAAENYETFVTQSSAPTLAGNEYKHFPVPDRNDVAIGDDGHYAGPVLILGAAAAHQHRMLSASPVVNIVNNDLDFLSTDAVGGNNWGLPFSIDSCSMRLEHLVYRPVHIGVNFVVPRALIQSDEGTASADLVAYVYSMSQPGPLVRPDSSPEQFLYYRTSVTITTDHGSGADAGEVATFGRVKVARDKRGFSYFAIGLDIDTGASSTARVRDWSLDPIVASTSDGPGTGGFGG